MTTALNALYQGLFTILDGTGVWGNRRSPDFAPATDVRPYCIYFWRGGGELNAVKQQDALFTVQVRCVADTMAESMQGASQISALLNDKGEKEVSTGYVYGGSDWIVLTVTQGRAFHLVEQFRDAKPIYHDGHDYEFRMEAR